jgi:hypothetical protein
MLLMVVVVVLLLKGEGEVRKQTKLQNVHVLKNLGQHAGQRETNTSSLPRTAIYLHGGHTRPCLHL